MRLAARRARRYLDGRRKREVAADLFADPAWDMLLDLFAAQIERRAVSISSACLASNCATSTAHLWLRKLEQANLLKRVPDPADRRRTFARITPQAAVMVERWLGAVFD